MSEDDADDIVDDWHRSLYPPGMELRDVFVSLYDWTDAQFETWVMTGRVPSE